MPIRTRMGIQMERSLFAYIWKHSKRQQLGLLALTLVTFPFLYVSLELPKRIINDAIGAVNSSVDLYGMTLTQVEFLLLLCVGFLASVLISGLLKMRLNTMKGVVAERLLRRLRYQLIHRMMRFPVPYFRTTSQGEMVSMITSEAEPMGGLMGDAVAQPVFQFGQMATILVFLFAQSIWFGLASVALIPLQAWLIPMLQRQINLLNKDRIQEIRHFSSEIGETAAGVADLRANGGWRYRLAQVTDRLGRLFDIRFRIYQKKFFMKFLNNMIGHLTPFLFYSAGGYLAIQGEITVGALVAALAAYKDLSGPWKELLTFYNQVQDMSLRWQIVMEKFAPEDMIDDALFEDGPTDMPHLDGEIEFRKVSVRDSDGNPVLEDINLTIPPATRVAVKSSRPSERAALGQLLSREVLPTRGDVILSGHNLRDLHQATIAARVGYANSRPYLFNGTLGDNLLMPLRLKPAPLDNPAAAVSRKRVEARRAGNSADPLEADWVMPAMAGLADQGDIRDWWFALIEAMGLDEEMLTQTLNAKFDPEQHRTLAGQIVALRGEILRELTDKGLSDCVYRFDPEAFNPALPLGGNLLYAAPRRYLSQDAVASDGRFITMLRDYGLDDEGLALAHAVIEMLMETFGREGTDHPLFLRLNMDEDVYLRLVDIAEKRQRQGDAGLTPDEEALLLTVPLLLTAEQIGPSFPEEYKAEILRLRRENGAQMREQTADLFVEITEDIYFPRLTVLENAVFGRISMTAGARRESVEAVVADVLTRNGLRQKVAATVYDMATGIGGANLPMVLQERAAFCRAAIKRPDILVLNNALASHSSERRQQTRENLRDLFPKTTIIFAEDKFNNPGEYDLFIEIKDGRIDGIEHAASHDLDEKGAADLRVKMRALSKTDLFGRLDTRNRRLMAFSAQWFDAVPGQLIFRHGESPDAVYLCISGEAELRWPDKHNSDRPVSVIQPGRLIGDLSIITSTNRPFDLIATQDSRFLRIGATEFREVMESDQRVAMQLLETVGGYLTEMGRRLGALGIDGQGDAASHLDKVGQEMHAPEPAANRED